MLFGDNMLKDEMGRVCCTFVREEECMQGFCWGYQKERDGMEDLGVEGRNTFKYTLKTWWEDADWIHAAQDRKELRTFQNTAMKHPVP